MTTHGIWDRQVVHGLWTLISKGKTGTIVSPWPYHHGPMHHFSHTDSRKDIAPITLLQNPTRRQEYRNTRQLLSKHGLHRMYTLHPSETFKILTQLPCPTPQNSQASPPPAPELHLHQHSRTSLAQAKGTVATVLPEQEHKSVPSVRTRDSLSQFGAVFRLSLWS